MATVAENLLKVNEGIDKVEALNAELARSLYGGDTGYRGYYDEFWDAYQENGNRTNYSYAFSGVGWTNDILQPKHLAKLEDCTLMFSRSKIDIDIFSHPKFDFSNITHTTQMFAESAFTKLGTYTANAQSGLRYMFYSALKLKSIEKLVVGESSYAQYYQNAFQNCTALEEVRFEGTIDKNGLSFQWSTKLSRASITNIINCLSTATTGLTVTLSKTAVESAFGSTTSTEWTNLIGTRSNWTISLV